MRAAPSQLYVCLAATSMWVGALASWAGEGALPRPLTLMEPGLRMPDYAFEERNSDGSQRDWGFIELRGKPVVLVFWATWCPVCAGEMRKLDGLAKAMKAEGVEVVALSVDKDGSLAAQRYLQRQGLVNLRVYHDTGSVLFSVLGGSGVPTAFIVDAEGYLRARAFGPVPWDEEPVRRYLRSLRSSQTPSQPQAGRAAARPAGAC